MPTTEFTQTYKDIIASPIDFTRDTLSQIDVSKRYVSVVIKDTVVHAFVDAGADMSEDYQ